MGRCIECGQHGLFLKLSPAGRCQKCQEIADRRERIEREKAERQKRMEKEMAELQAKRQEEHARMRAAFMSKLAAIPKSPIGTDGQKQPVRAITPLDELKYTNVTSRSNYALLGEFVSIDIETCGLKATDPIVEVSAIHFDGYEPISIFTTLVNPQREIPASASKVNKITDDMVKSAPTIWQIMPSLQAYTGTFPIIGHNIPFDLKFLYRHGFDIAPKQKLYDTLDLAHRTLKKPRDVYDYKLDSCCAFYGIPYFGAHRSAADAYVTGLLFKALVHDRAGS